MGFLDIGGAILGAATGGALDFLGQASANDANIDIMNQTNAFNQEEARRNRAFQSSQARIANRFSASEAGRARTWMQRVSSNAHTREVADLKRAGLNPILSSRYGGSSAPSTSAPTGQRGSGAQASGVTARIENELGGAVHSAREAATTVLDYRANREAVATAKATRANIEADTANKGLQGEEIAARIGEIMANTSLKGATKDQALESIQLIREQALSQAQGRELSRTEMRGIEGRLALLEQQTRSAKVDAEIAEAYKEILTLGRTLFRGWGAAKSLGGSVSRGTQAIKKGITGLKNGRIPMGKNIKE